MAVIVVHKNESIDSVLRRFQRQVIKEGIISDVLEKRFYVSKTAAKRLKMRELERSRRRKRTRMARKPKTSPKLKRSVI